MNTGLGGDSNQTTPDDITLIAISDGYLDGYWAQVDANLDLHVTSKQNGIWSMRTQDGYGTAISSSIVGGKDGLDVNVINTIPVTLTYDTNYGVVGANTLRTAAQIGNSTGQADFNVGTTTAQTLRVTSNLSDGYANRITSAAHPTQSYRGLDEWPLKGVIQHFNGTTANTSAITITPAAVTMSILIYNPGTNAASSTVSASFDGGTNYFTIPLGSNLNAETEVASFLIKGSAASIAYQILVTHR